MVNKYETNVILIEITTFFNRIYELPMWEHCSCKKQAETILVILKQYSHSERVFLRWNLNSSLVAMSWI